MISSLHAAILGIVEGLTEFLPVSSTGHLILTSHWLGLGYGEGIKAFEVVIQSGALLAIIGLYLPAIRSMILGLMGRDPEGLTLVRNLFAAFLPAAVVGLLAESKIKAVLFGAWPVVLALAVGGILMILIERYARRRAEGQAPVRTIPQMTVTVAVLIGCAQCLAMWPGTSRSMVTMLAALLLGFSPREAAKFSFLLALPTLGAATAHDLLKDGKAILEVANWSGLVIGFVVSFVVAWLAVKGFIAYLTRHGLSLFGWYRIALAGLMAYALLSQVTLTGKVVDNAAGKPVLRVENLGDRLIYPNPVGNELIRLVGRQVLVSGSLLKDAGGEIKVLNYRVLDKKLKAE